MWYWRDSSILRKIFDFSKCINDDRLIDDFCFFYTLFIQNKFDNTIFWFDRVWILIKKFLNFSFYFAIFFCVRIEIMISIFHKKLLLKINYINFYINLISIYFIFEISFIDRIEMKSFEKNDSNLIVIIELFIFVFRISSLLHYNKLNICLYCEKINFVVLNRNESNLFLIIEQLILLTFLLIVICKNFITHYEINIQ